MGMIVRDLHPLNIVNGEGFKVLLSYLEPGYQLPLGRYFMGLIEQKFVDVRESVKLRLQQESAFVDLTSEQWNLLAEYNVSISALQPIVHGLTRSMEVTEEDSQNSRTC